MPLTAATSAREMLTGLHGLMAKRGSAQAQLHHLVDLIAEAMASGVCSNCLLRNNKLELSATHGLRKEVVHVTRLAMGKGLPRPSPPPGAYSISLKPPATPPSPIGRNPARRASTASPAC